MHPGEKNRVFLPTPVHKIMFTKMKERKKESYTRFLRNKRLLGKNGLRVEHVVGEVLDLSSFCVQNILAPFSSIFMQILFTDFCGGSARAWGGVCFVKGYAVWISYPGYPVEFISDHDYIYMVILWQLISVAKCKCSAHYINELSSIPTSLLINKHCQRKCGSKFLVSVS